MNLEKSLESNKKLLSSTLPIGQSFDVIGRDFMIGKRNAYLVFVDGFAKDDILLFLMKNLQNNGGDDDLASLKVLLANRIPYIETDIAEQAEDVSTAVLSGAAALIADGLAGALILDVRQYPVRNPEESDSERVTHGAKDGLVETLIFNTALIRRRIRDPKLIFELTQIGTRSKTDATIAYIGDLADKTLLNHIRQRLRQIDIPALPMGEKNLEESLLKKHWYNPLPQLRITGRPDTAAAHLLEGHILLLVDTAPTAIILPTTLFSFTQYPEEYYQTPLAGTYTRILRFLAIPLVVLLTPLWLLLAENQANLPPFLQFIGTKEPATLSLFLQLLLLEFGLDFLRLSSLQVPKNLGATLGIIGGLIIGDFAVQVGVFVPETIFYMALVAILSYCIPNAEFASALRLFRLFLLLLTGFFRTLGFIFGLAILLILTAATETFPGAPNYLWPLIPFQWQALKHILFRSPVSAIHESGKKK